MLAAAAAAALAWFTVSYGGSAQSEALEKLSSALRREMQRLGFCFGIFVPGTEQQRRQRAEGGELWMKYCVLKANPSVGRLLRCIHLGNDCLNEQQKKECFLNIVVKSVILC